MQLNGSVAVVTGGASGLGGATVRTFAENGCKVAIFDLAEEAGSKLAAELGDSAIFLKTNVADAQSVQDSVNKVVERFGGIHIAVNCAGIAVGNKLLTKEGPHSLDLFNKVIQVNLVGTFNVIRLVAEQMTKNAPGENGERGVIISTASVAAFEGQIGQVAYSASKNGVIGMTLPVARELAGYGIRVMVIAPGIFQTPMLASLPEKVQDALGQMVPFPQRLGKPAEYARLAKDIVENQMLNGWTIRLDGAIRLQPK